MTERERIFNKYIERVKIDYPEDDKLWIDLQDFERELLNVRGEDETQAVRPNEQIEKVCKIWQCGNKVTSKDELWCDDCIKEMEADV